ncbi:hypothetical protein [Paraflavitalea speifideaquila]|uniref:hypothetical protein n=1 Tax=Paraflavitalea speifideaquila TaxID=3076558 RepID=UPI0028E87628|nr:hypothetical protein [Paraflavitalea speifideiaquila]
MDKFLAGMKGSIFKEKKNQKKEKEKEWASPMDYFIRFVQALDQSIYPDLIT